MMIGLGAIQTSGTDMCLDYSTRQQIPCYPRQDNMVCLDENSGQQGKCSQLPNGTPVPIVTLQEALAMCSGKPLGSCQVITAAPCDPLWVAAGFQQCQQQGMVTYYTQMLKDYSGSSQYDAPITPKNLALSPSDVYYLMNNNLIAPITNSGAQITPTYNPSTGYQASTPPPTVYSFGQGGTTQITTAPQTGPLTQAPQTQQQQSPVTQQQQIPGGTIPGSNTAIGGTATMTPQTGAPSGSTGGTSSSGNVMPKSPDADPTQLLAGIPNTYLYIGGAVLALLLLKK